VQLLTMESSQDDKVNMQTPPKSSVIKGRGGQQHVFITYHIQSQLLDPNHFQTCRFASAIRATELVKASGQPPQAMAR